MDLVDYDRKKFEKLKNDLSGFLLNLKIIPSYVIQYQRKRRFHSQKTGKLDWYEGPTVLEALDTFKTKKVQIRNHCALWYRMYIVLIRE